MFSRSNVRMLRSPNLYGPDKASTKIERRKRILPHESVEQQEKAGCFGVAEFLATHVRWESSAIIILLTQAISIARNFPQKSSCQLQAQNRLRTNTGNSEPIEKLRRQVLEERD